MDGVEFEDNKIGGTETIVGLSARPNLSRLSALTRLFIRVGIAKDEKSAQFILLVLFFACFAGSIAVVVYVVHSSNSVQVKYALPPEVLKHLPKSVRDKINTANKSGN